MGLIHQTPVIIEKRTRDGFIKDAKIQFIEKNQDEFIKMLFTPHRELKHNQLLKTIRSEFGYSQRTYHFDIWFSFRRLFFTHYKIDY